jgi:opacity protein-like surface antigen
MSISKSALAAVAAMMIAAPALAADNNGFAPYATATYAYQDTKGTSGFQQGAYVAIGNKFSNMLSLEVAGEIMDPTNSTKQQTRVEVAAIPSYSVGAFTGYVRGAVGEGFQNSQNWTYWSVEPGVKVFITPDLSAKVGYRFRDSFDSGVLDRTQTYRVGLDYAINKQVSLNLGYDRVTGDKEANVYLAGLTVRF